jgi:phage repressor protein C with HTH and peptisase S24 domain
MSLGKNVKRLRELSGIALEPLAEMLGLERAAGRQKIYAMEKRDSKKSDIAGLLAHQFGISMESLLQDDLSTLTFPEWEKMRAEKAERRRQALLAISESEQALADLEARREEIVREMYGDAAGVELFSRNNNLFNHLSNEVNPTDHDQTHTVKKSPDLDLERNETDAVPLPIQYPVDTRIARRVVVVSRPDGGLPEKMWTDGDQLVGATEKFAEIATSDPRAFLVPVLGHAMAPRYNAGEFALVEPEIEPELEDDVLVRLVTGETTLRRLLARRGGIRLGSYNDGDVQTFEPGQIAWMYYVAHPVPARKIKHAK